MTKDKVPNVHKCEKALWDKFSSFQKRLYNAVRSLPQDLMKHPKTNLPPEEWKTISHNMACEAAWQANDVLSETTVDEIYRR